MSDEKESLFTVLIVDDNKDNRDIAKLFLGSAKYEFLESVNGLEAIECFKKNKVDLILMDIRMPVMDGFEATSKIRNEENGKDVPIIFCTANYSEESFEEALKSGADMVLCKPINRALLRKTLEEKLSIN